MGAVHAEIKLENYNDVVLCTQGIIKEHDVRTITVTSLVDTGAASLVINEEQRKALGLGIMEQRKARVADGRWVFCQITEGVKIHWKDRWMLCPAMVIPSADEVLLGAIPLEGMDLIISPAKQELVGAHGDEIRFMVLQAAGY
jgi:clan AA aspartic protease